MARTGPAGRTLAEDLALTPDGGRLVRVIDGYWTFADRIFGGYSAALLAAAAARRSRLPELLSASTTFVRPLVPGRIEIEVDEIRSGRSSWVGRAVLYQHGRPGATADLWFAPDGTLPAVHGSDGPPRGAYSIEWLRELYGFLSAFSERALAYPTHLGMDIPEPPPRIEVWARPDPTLDVETPLQRQLFTLMLVDGHIIDAAARPYGLDKVLGISHNLVVHWAGLPVSGDWFQLRAEASGSSAGVCTRADLHAEDGLCALALQQGRVLDHFGQLA